MTTPVKKRRMLSEAPQGPRLEHRSGHDRLGTGVAEMRYGQRLQNLAWAQHAQPLENPPESRAE
eukprot:10118649-Lingulodinium_polyedra.AAC.1